MRPAPLVLLAVAGACGGAAPPAPSPQAAALLHLGHLTQEATFDQPANGWASVERWHDSNPGFIPADYPRDGRGDQDGQRLAYFGEPRPAAGTFLFYSAPAPAGPARPTPVLLVHGANDNADRGWANPSESGGFGCGALSCPSSGLMQALAAGGASVYAVSFAHKQGDAYDWGEVIGDAIAIIRARTGAAQVDVVAWSLGAFAARLYVSGLRQGWGTPYGADVRRLVLLGNPNTGFDYLFRHGWWHDFSVFPECGVALNEPSPHSDTICYGVSAHHPELSVLATSAGDFYPGQRQMLARLDQLHPLGVTDQDWYTTYHGGAGLFTKGGGIDAAIQQGSLVEPILAAGTPAGVATYLLCGDSPTIPFIHDEHTGPSDGVVFLDVCLDGRGIGNLAGSRVVSGINHLQLGWAADAVAVIRGWVEAP